MLTAKVRATQNYASDNSQLPLHDDVTLQSRQAGKKTSSRASLMSLRMLPLFFAASDLSVMPKHIDVDHMLVCLRALTYAVDLDYQASASLAHPAVIQRHSKQTEKYLLQIGHIWVKTHAESLVTSDGRPENNGGLRSAWGGMTACAMLYLNAILAYTNSGEPLAPRMIQRAIAVVDRDLSSREFKESEWNTLEGDCWLWKAYVARVAVARARQIGLYETPLESTEMRLNLHIRKWAERTKSQSWEVTLLALQRIAWPSTPISDAVAQTVWDVVMTLPDNISWS